MNLFSHTLLVLCTCLLVKGQLLHAQEEDGSADYLSPFNVIGSKEDVPVLEGTGSVLETTDLNAFFHTDMTINYPLLLGVEAKMCVSRVSLVAGRSTS